MFSSEQNVPLNGSQQNMTRNERKLQATIRRNQAAIDGFSMSGDTYEKGMLRTRRPTDLAFIIGFSVFMIVVAGVGISQAMTADFKKLLAHQDSNGRFCGITPGFEEYPLVYWSFDLVDANLTQAIWDSAVCVKECPATEMDTVETPGTSNQTQTSINYHKRVASTERNVMYPKEYGKIGGMCIPNSYDAIAVVSPSQAALWDPKGKTKLQNHMWMSNGGGEVDQDIAENLERNQWSIFICAVTALIFTPLYLYIMAYFPTYLAYTVIGLINVAWMGLIGGGLYISLALGTTDNSDSRSGGFVMSGVGLLFAIIFDLLLWCRWAQFKQAIAIVDAVAHFFITTKRILLVSFAVFILEIFAMCGAFAYFIALCGNLEVTSNPASLDRQGKLYSGPYFLQLSLVLLFAYLWLNNYFKNTGVMTMMCSVSTYYFNSNSDGEGEAEVGQAMSWAFLTHAGSVAYGSLIMAIIQFLQVLCEAAKGDKGEGEDSAVRKIAECCLKCLEDIVEYINTTAYANMSVTGTSFCTSAWNGFILNLKHCVKFYFAKNLAGWFVVIGYIFVLFLQGVVFFLVTPYLGDAIFPAIIVFVFSISVCGITLGFFDEAVSACLQCMAIDAELNSGMMTTFAYGPPTFHAKMNAVFMDDKE